MQSTDKLLVSERLNQVVKEWFAAGRKSEVYKKADYVIDGRHEKFYDAIYFMCKAFCKFDKEIPFSIWIVRLESYFCNLAAKKERSLLFCAYSEEEILSLFTNLIPKKKVETSKSVLVKMTRTVLFDLRKEILDTVFTVPHDPIPLRDINTIEVLNDILNEFQLRKHWIGRKHPVSRFKKLLNKPNFTEEILKEAWQYILINEIHET